MKEEEEELEKEDVVVGWEPMGLRRRRLAMILTEKEKEEERIEFEIQRKKERKSERERGSKGRASRGFVLQRAPAAFQAGLTLCPSGSLAGVLSRWQLRHRDFSSPGYPPVITPIVPSVSVFLLFSLAAYSLLSGVAHVNIRLLCQTERSSRFEFVVTVGECGSYLCTIVSGQTNKEPVNHE